MSNKFKGALSSILAFVMVVSTLTVMNVSSVFANTITATLGEGYDTSATSPALVSYTAIASTVANNKTAYDTWWVYDADAELDSNSYLTATGYNSSLSGATATLKFGGDWTKKETKRYIGLTYGSDSSMYQYSGTFYDSTGILTLTTTNANQTILIDWYSDGSSKTIKATDSDSTSATTSSSANKNSYQTTITVADAGEYTLTFSDATNMYIGAIAVYDTPVAETYAAAITITNAETGNAISDASISNVTATYSEGVYSATLTDGTTYTVSADGYESKTFKADSSVTALSIALNPQYTLDVTGPNGCEVYILDSTGANKVDDDGLNATLTYGTTYRAAADGYVAYDFTVSSADGDSKELAMTAMEESSFTDDFSITFSTAYASNDKIADGVYILDDVTLTTDANQHAASDSTQTSYITNSTGSPRYNTNKVPVAGVVLKFVAGANGTLTVDYLINSGKSLYITTVSTDGNTVTTVVGDKTTAKGSDLATITVASGNTYYVYADGSKLGFYKATFTTTDYYYALIDAEKVGDSEIPSFSIYKTEDSEQTALADEDGTTEFGTVYESVDIDGDGVADYTPEDGKYVVAFIVSTTGVAADDIQSYFGVKYNTTEE